MLFRSQAGRTQNVSGRGEARFPTFDGFKPVVEGLGMEMAHRIFRVELGVERKRWFVFGKTVFVGKERIFFLDVTTVGQQDLTQIAGARGGVDATPETLLGQQGHIAAVIEVGMGENDGVDVIWRKGQGRPIAQAKLLVALEQTAIHQQALAIVLNGVFGTGDGAGTAQKS